MGLTVSTKSEKQWQAEEDARTLASAAAIEADKKRMAAAAKVAAKMAKEAEVKAKTLKKVAKKRK